MIKYAVIVFVVLLAAGVALPIALLSSAGFIVVFEIILRRPRGNDIYVTKQISTDESDPKRAVRNAKAELTKEEWDNTTRIYMKRKKNSGDR